MKKKEGKTERTGKEKWKIKYEVTLKIRRCIKGKTENYSKERVLSSCTQKQTAKYKNWTKMLQM